LLVSYVQPTIQQYESITLQLCNQSSPHENYGQFPLLMEAITCLPQNRHFFAVSKDE